MVRKKKPVVAPWVANLIAIIVTIVWSATILMTLWSSKYQVDPKVHVVFLAVLGGIFGTQIKGGNE